MKVNAHAHSSLISAILVGGLLSACGQGASQGDLDRARAAGAADQAQKATQAALAADVQRLKADAAKRQESAAPAASAAPVAVPFASSASSASAAPALPSPVMTSCGGNTSVGPNTSCAFGQNVAVAYYDYSGGGTAHLQVYSPVTGTYYSMTCVPGVPVSCSGGNNATVYLR